MLPYLEVHTLACFSFMDACCRYKSSGLEMKDNIFFIAKAVTRAVAFFFSEHHSKKAHRGLCYYRRGTSSLGNQKFKYWPEVCLTFALERETLSSKAICYSKIAKKLVRNKLWLVPHD